MTQELIQKKQEIIDSMVASPYLYLIPQGKDFTLTYRYYPRSINWRVSLMAKWDTGSVSIENVADLNTREDARRMVYRLNGWGEPNH